MTYAYQKLIVFSLILTCFIVGAVALGMPTSVSAQMNTSCTLPDGTTIQSGEYRMFYSASSVVSPASCSSVSGYRICYYGYLFGDPKYNKSSCAVVDVTAPQVSLTTPAAGATVSGIVAVAADATDDTDVLGVRFSIDGKLIGAEDTSAPFTINWDSKTVANGVHTLAATARDATGNRATSTMSVTVQNTVATTTVRPATIGYIIKILSGNGVAQGWAFDRAASSTNIDVNFYVNNPAELGGTYIGTAKADTLNKPINWQYGIDGNHGFSFRIPDSLRDGQSHTLFVQPVGVNGRLGSLIHASTGLPFTISASSTAGTAPVTDASCLDDTSRCPSAGSDYLAPNYPTASGWSDGKNYFNEWQCTSSSGINYITRLNILPLGTIGPNVQKDSTFTSWYSDQNKSGSPAVYFVVSSFDKAPIWSLKKAIYSNAEGKWNIYSVLDSPTTAGGLSSQVGRGKYFVMNDYGLPGWGPTSPVPGSQNKIPGVSNVNANPHSLSYPLVGSGPLGITAITNAVWPSTRSGGPEGRTCIHMNPKLMDYDATGAPQTLLVNMWQNNIDQACPLPAGAPIAKLPYPGAYLYRYKGAALGWQLDLDKGLVNDSLYNDLTNSMRRRGNLLAWTDHTIVEARWDGVVYTNDLGKPDGENTEILLDCKSSGMHFGEGSGLRNALFFLGAKPDIAGERAKWGLSNSVLPVDIYYAFQR